MPVHTSREIDPASEVCEPDSQKAHINSVSDRGAVEGLAKERLLNTREINEFNIC